MSFFKKSFSNHLLRNVITNFKLSVSLLKIFISLYRGSVQTDGITFEFTTLVWETYWKTTLFCLFKIMKNIQAWWSPLSLRKKTMPHGDSHYGDSVGHHVALSLRGIKELLTRSPPSKELFDAPLEV